ncbi:GntR family transcriptional regulator [Intestinibacter bartlettii]|uniref:GntR family transcriptional regulator n=1 Tax=Intestinibacter bartlettii TaxID=261299 RepID=UPI00082198D6|nr:GntR family transcriptional regulator [Intestinibacter bartlettii]SCJ20805.1 Trehalose operon transcriptional repressor [uncultured Clostridium sp.]
MNDINIRKKIKEPKYVTIYNILFKMITLGEFSKNDRLPSEPDLARDLGVSRTTLRQALTLLQEDGLIKIIRGKGNFITKDSHYINTIPNNKIQSSVYNFLSNSNKIDDIEMEFHLEPCSDYFHMILGSKPAAVVVIDRWYKIDKKVVAYAFSIMPIDNISKFDIDLNNHEQLLNFVEKDIYNDCNNIMLDVKFSISGNYASKRSSFLDNEQFFLIEEKVSTYNEFTMEFSKFYLPVDMSSIRINLKR